MRTKETETEIAESVTLFPLLLLLFVSVVGGSVVGGAGVGAHPLTDFYKRGGTKKKLKFKVN